MTPALGRRGVVAVKAARMADVARLLLGDCLVARERKIDLVQDLLSVFEGESVSFRPADRLGICE